MFINDKKRGWDITRMPNPKSLFFYIKKVHLEKKSEQFNILTIEY